MDIIEEEVKTKRCSKCGRILPLSEFYKDKRAKDGLKSECKECHIAMQAEYYKANKDKIAEYGAQYRKDNKEAIAQRYAQYYQANKKKIKAYNANYKDPQKNPMGYAKYMVAHYRRMDRERGFDDSKTITAEWFLENIMYRPCAHCGKVGYGLIGCNRLDNTKGHIPSNCEPCCSSCNSRQNCKDMLERGLYWFQKGKKVAFKTFVKEHKAKDKNLT